jgi:hypothetical protein
MEVLEPKDEDAPSSGKDSPTAGQPRAWSAAPEKRAGSVDRGSVPRAVASLRVGALGLSLWIVSVAVPLAEGGAHSIADIVLVVLPLAALGLGVRFFLRDRPEATPLLAIAVPTLIATAMAGRADPALAEHYGAPLVILSGVAMLAYVVAAAHALARPSMLRETRVSKLAAAADTSARARALRALVLGTTALAGLGLTIVAPALGSRATYVTSWGEAAEEGRVLVAIVAATVATLALTVIVGPALRAPRQGEVRAGSDGVTIAASIVVAVTGVMAWAILRFVERS